MNKRYFIRKVGPNIHVCDRYNYNKVVFCYDKTEEDDANQKLEDLNETYEIKQELKQLEKELSLTN